MPAVAIAVVASAASSAVAGAAIFGSTFLGSTILAGIANKALGALVSTAINRIGGSLIGGGKRKGGGGGSATQNLDGGLKQVVRLSSDSHKLVYGRARVGGTLCYIETYPTANDSDGVSQTGDNLFLHMVVIHCGHEIESYDEIHLNDDLVTLDANGFVNEAPYKKDGKSYVRIKHHFGSDTQLADSFLTAEAANWSSNHRLRGLAYTYMRLQWNPDVFTNGIPTLNVVIKGKKVFDPRTSTTVWTDNAALCVRDYLTARDIIGLPFGFGASVAEIDDTYTTAAANVCDETITKLDSSTIKRYTVNGIVDTASTPLGNVEDMLSSMVGTITTPRGVFRIYAGAYDTPETTVIDESWLSGNIKSTNRIERQQLFNAIRGRYVEPSKQWQSDDFPPITSSTFEAEDNGERIFTEIELPYTIDAEGAQRIAKIVQRKGREQISVTMSCSFKALQFAVWDTVKVNNTALGWSEKVFRIVNWNFDIKQGVVLQLREENSLSYSWTATDGEAVANAPDTNLPSPRIVNAPASVSYNSRATQTVGGDTVYNLVLQWAAYENAYVTNGGSFEVQFRESVETDWRPSFFVDGNSTFADIASTSPNTLYDLRVRAVNVLGARSGWVQIDDALIGSSGGVLFSLDWGAVSVGAIFFNNWDSVAASVTTFNDWGSVT